MRKMQHKTEVVKNVLINIFISLFSITALAQQTNFLIDLDSIAEEYSVSHFSLSTRDIYGTNDSVYLFNVIPKYIEDSKENPEFARNRTNYVFLFTVFPTLNSSEQWVSFDKFPNHFNLLSFDKLLTIGGRFLYYENRLKTPENYGIILKKGDKYFKSAIGTLQIFYITNFPNEFNIPKSVIDINQALITVKDMQNVYKNFYNDTDLPIGPRSNPKHLINNNIERFYLSKKSHIKGRDAYQFWTFQPWNEISDNINWEQGIDRFIYIPDKGIVGGSFDFYFYYHRQKLGMTTLDFKNNIREEKVMLAEQYK
ncbi:hypothetical protein ACR78F_06110 [Sphingobacterium spiritivorum]|uniref:hypothetical protein n=1 Tax=Sphingobacterium spiritivorum TaxID=258 RepID=UPI003DA45790